MKEYNGAAAIYTQLLTEKDNPNIQTNLTAALVSLGDEYLQAHNYSLATETFERAVERGTKDSYAYYGLAKSYRACGIDDKAAEYYEKAISMEPEKVEYSNEFAEFISSTQKTADVKTDTQPAEIKEVTLSMDEADKVEADDAQYNKDLIAIGDENYKKKNYDVSIRNYQDALKLNPSDEVTLLKLGNIYKIKMIIRMP